MSFDEAWRRAALHLEAALAHAGGTHALSDVAAMVARGEAQFWAAPRSAMVTVVQEDPRERRLLIWLAGGELAELVRQLLPEAESYARANGCRRLMVIGRAGWERALKPEGFAPVARLIAKDL